MLSRQHHSELWKDVTSQRNNKYLNRASIWHDYKFVFISFSRLTSGSIGSEEEFNMANGDASSSDSAPSLTNRPAIQQFRKQKEQAAVEGMSHIIMIWSNSVTHGLVWYAGNIFQFVSCSMLLGRLSRKRPLN